MKTIERDGVPNHMKDVDKYICPIPEKQGLLIPVTIGCSYNNCTFCLLYEFNKYRELPIEEILAAIDHAAPMAQEYETVFLRDGDPLIVSTDKLLKVLDAIYDKMPWIKRVAAFVDASNLKNKSVEDLIKLREAGLTRLYIGLESGDNETLRRVKKRSTAEQILKAGQKIKEAGIELTVNFMLGIAGRERSKQHAMSTGRILTMMNPDNVNAIVYIPIEGTPLYDDIMSGKFGLMDHDELIEEVRILMHYTQITSLFKIQIR